MRSSVVLVTVAALATAAAAWKLRPGANDVPLAELEAKYRTADSRFLEIDGLRVHYMDQGQGPAVVLLHASFMHLRTWDGLAEALRANHRVIRPDLLNAGLTGPSPGDDYSMDRNVRLVDELTRRLGIDRFAIVATSSGGIVGFNYAAQHPERVTRLVLMNSAGMPRTAATNPNRPRGTALSRWWESRTPSPERVRATLAENFVPPHEPPEWLVQMNYDLWRRAGRAREGALQMQQFRTGDPEAVLARVRAPTMILWGLENRTVMHLEADVFQHWLINAPTLKRKYPGVGHYMYLEEPDLFEREIGDFLAGRLDGELRRVRLERIDGTPLDAAPTSAPPQGARRQAPAST